MRALGICDYKAYLKCVTEDASVHEMVQLVDAISTNVTSFFREDEHFAFIADAAAGLGRRGRQRYRSGPRPARQGRRRTPLR